MTFSIKSTTVTGLLFAFGALTLYATVLYTAYPVAAADQHWNYTVGVLAQAGAIAHLPTRTSLVKNMFDSHRSLYENIRVFTGTLWVLGIFEWLLKGTDLATAPDPRLYALFAFFYLALGTVIHYYTHSITRLAQKRNALTEDLDT